MSRTCSATLSCSCFWAASERPVFCLCLRSCPRRGTRLRSPSVVDLKFLQLSRQVRRGTSIPKPHQVHRLASRLAWARLEGWPCSKASPHCAAAPQFRCTEPWFETRGFRRAPHHEVL